MANNKTKKMANNKTKKTPTVTTTSTGNPLYHVGATGRDVDTVGNYLVNNGYMDSYNKVYDQAMQNALVQAKQDLLGPNSTNGGAYKGATFGAATLNAIDKANQNAQNDLIQQKIDEALAPYLDLRKQYENMFAIQQQQYAAQQDAIRQNTQATIDSINSNKQGINDEYEKAARENYINSVLQKNQNNDYMQAMGYNGGMTETSLAGINANYENNRANAISERDAALREIERLVAEAQASGNSDLANAANNYYNSYISALQNQAQMNYQISQDQQAQANADRDYQLQLDQIAWNKQQYNNERADAANQASEQAKQQIAANDFEAFLNTYQGKYNKQATYEKWIENLKKMDDPYGYNRQKIAYLTQWINSGMGKKSSTGSSGGGGGGKPIDNQKPKAPVANYDDVRYTAVAMISNNSIYGPGNAAEYIKSSGLSDIEKEKLYRELGLL